MYDRFDPPPSWYEPPDEIEDDDTECAFDPEPFVVSGDVITWTATA